jgi:hypothetical protein
MVLKEQPEDVVERASLQASREADFLYNLATKVNTQVLTRVATARYSSMASRDIDTRSAWIITVPQKPSGGILIARRWAMLLLSLGRFSQAGIHPAPSHQLDAVRFRYLFCYLVKQEKRESKIISDFLSVLFDPQLNREFSRLANRKTGNG